MDTIKQLARVLGVECEAIIAKCKAEGVCGIRSDGYVSEGLALSIREWFSTSPPKTTVEQAPRTEKALGYFKDQDTFGGFLRARFRAARALLENGKITDAVAVLRATSMPPALPRAREQIAEQFVLFIHSLEKDGRMKDAAVVRGAMANSKVSDLIVEARVCAAGTYRDRGEMADAVAVLRGALTPHARPSAREQIARQFLLLIQSLERDGPLEDAVMVWESMTEAFQGGTASEASDLMAEARIRIVEIYRKHGKITAAIAVLWGALRPHALQRAREQIARQFLLLIQSLERDGPLEDAVMVWESMTEAFQGDTASEASDLMAEARIRIVEIYRKHGNVTDAATVIEGACAQEGAVALRDLAGALTKLGSQETAQRVVALTRERYAKVNDPGTACHVLEARCHLARLVPLGRTQLNEITELLKAARRHPIYEWRERAADVCTELSRYLCGTCFSAYSDCLSTAVDALREEQYRQQRCGGRRGAFRYKPGREY